MRSVEEHQRVVTELITARPAVAVELRDAEGLVLAEDVTATLSLPVFDNSAMDGYAVRADEVASATAERPVKLLVAEDIPAGRTDKSHDSSRRMMAHQFLVFGQQDRLVRQSGAHHPGNRRATIFHDKQLY